RVLRGTGDGDDDLRLRVVIERFDLQLRIRGVATGLDDLRIVDGEPPSQRGERPLRDMHRSVGGGTVRAARVIFEVHLALDGELEVGRLHVQVIEIEVRVHAELRGLARL